MKLPLQFLLVSFLFSVTSLVAQVGINTTTPNAQLEIKSSNEAAPLNTDGLIIPKVDTFPATNPTVDQQGMLVYLTTAFGSNSPGFYYWNNPTTSWLPIAGVVTPGWNLVGNAGTNPATNFLGTTNNQDLVFRRNNVLSGRLSTSNTAFGVSSLEANTGGFFNTAFGVNTLQVNTIGSDNTAIGLRALSNNTTGTANASVGAFTLVSNTTGNFNTAVGFGSNVGANNLTNASAIGARASVGANNALVLGSINGVNGAAATVNVGIGTTTPLDRLHVVGNIRMVDGNQAAGRVLTSDANGTAIWQNASANAWGLLGNAGTNPALNFIGTADNQDVVFKRNNLLSGRIEPLSTSFGLSALSVNTGLRNTAFGSAALELNTTGTQNTAIGRAALQNNTTGRDNSASGLGALQFNTEGSFNTAYGSFVLHANTLGNNNTATGYFAMRFNTEGSNNTAMGQNALRQNLTGVNNTGIGLNTLFNNSTGTDNTALGIFALDANTTGSQNTAIGLRSNVGANNLTNATALGARARVDNNNAMVLGSINGINGATATVNVGIGTTNPLERLHVVGNIRMVDGNQATGRVLTSDANGTATWQNASANAWGLLGNGGTNAATNFMGTIDNQDVVFRRNNFLSGRLGLTNTAFGVNSLIANTTGFSNTAIGLNSLLANTTGSDNTAIGTSALLVNTTGSNNTGIGTVVLRNNTLGTSNTAIGRLAMNFNTEGSNNTATGERALVNNLTGNNNTAFGLNALFNNTTGTENAAMGIFALDANTVGSQNTAVGLRANVGANNLTNATAIGARARVDASNALVLGSVNGLNGATANVNVGIGTTNPLDRLHVVGNIRMVDGNQAAGRVLTSDANGTATWQNASTNAWGLLGNTATDPAVNFIGTTDNQDVIFRRNNSIAGRLGTTNTAFGNSTLTVSTGINNTAIGSSALSGNSTGLENTAVGTNVLRLNTTGVENTALGFNSMPNNTTGSRNVAIGRNALTNNTDGTDNTFIGYRTNKNTPSVSNATAIGARAYAGANNSVVIGSINGINGATATVNVGIGTFIPLDRLHVEGNIRMTDGNQAAGRVLTSDANGRATWQNASANAWGLLGNAGTNPATNFIGTTDDQDVVFRRNNTNSGRIGASNTAFGVDALLSNTTGIDNTAVGQTALRNGTGNFNSAFGTFALQNLTIGSNNTAIGYNAQVPTATANNQVRIGNTFITYAGIQVGWTTTSDLRWKENIQPTSLGLNFINDLRPVSYQRNNDENKKTEYGFIAQELENALLRHGAVNNGIISRDDQGMLGVRYNDLLAPMVKAIQELKTENDGLEKKNEAVAAENKQLKEKVAQQEALLQSILNRLNALEKK